MNAKDQIRRFYLFTFFGGMHMFSAVLIPFYTEWAGMSQVVALGLQSFFMISVFALEIPTGVIADMIGRKKSLAVGSLFSMIACLIYGIYPNLILFFIGEFLFAIGVAFMSGADRALIYDILSRNKMEKRSVEVFGKSKSIHLIGIAAGSLIGGFLAKNLGLNYPMLLTSIPVLISGLLILGISEPKDSGAVKEQRNFLVVLKSGFRPLKRSSVLRRWTINATLVSTAAYFVIWLYQPLMTKIGISFEYFGIAHAGLVASEVFVALSLRKMMQKFASDKFILNLSALLVSVSTISVALYPNVITLVLFLVLAGGFGLTRFEFMSARMNKLIDSAARSTTLSSISMVSRISNAVFNPVIGYLGDQSIVYPLLLIGLLPLLTVFASIKDSDIEPD